MVEEHMRIYSIVTLIGLTVLTHSASALDDGLYAVFHTSMGSFTSQLYYTDAPMTVANFVGLAEGTQAWMDAETGAVRSEPFYDGIIFHRVITNFMSQAGSRNQLGTDGPGYRFPDEISSSRLHDQVGVLSMANSGFHSNGSQFFITAGPTPWLDGLHTVFGQVISGQTVVDSINQVTVNTNDRPLVDVTIESIDILRMGEDAIAFDASDALPVLGEGRLEDIYQSGETLHLGFEPQSDHQYVLRASVDMANWSVSGNPQYAHEFEEIEPGFSITNSAKQSFYALTQLKYPGNDYSPESIDGKTIEFEFTAPVNLADTRISYLVDLALEQSVQLDGDPFGAINDYVYENIKYPHQASLLILGTQLVRIDYRMNFLSPTNGAFTGIIYFPAPENQAQGTFSISE